MSSATVYTCDWCGLTAPADSSGSDEYLPKGWTSPPDTSDELCSGCMVARSVALDSVKSQRKGLNKGTSS